MPERIADPDGCFGPDDWEHSRCTDTCPPHGRVYDPSEQDELLDIFRDMLRGPTGDGGAKRASGTKPSWKIDPDHEAGLFSHLAKWKKGELVDPDSGSHPLVHLAWRALAIAWQEMALVPHDRIGDTDYRITESVQKVSTPAPPFKHEPCRRCQTERKELAAQRTDTNVTPPA